MNQRVTILGVPVDVITIDQAVRSIMQMVEGAQFNHVMTPNNEMVVMAQTNMPFQNVLQATALNLPDSTGLMWAANRQGQPLPERVTGVDTVQHLCAQLDDKAPVYFLGAAQGIALKAAEKLKQKNPRLNIAGAYPGSPSEAEEVELCSKITESGAKILLVAFGAPKQDLWIARNAGRLPNVRVAMGVGGTFDFITGRRKRAPKWMQQLGLEWFWRLLQEPTRLVRIWQAVVVFPRLVLSQGK